MKNKEHIKNKPVNKEKTKIKKKGISRNKIILSGVLILSFIYVSINFSSTSESAIEKAETKDRAPITIDNYKEGNHFYVLSEKIDNFELEESKLNVTKFFWYGCSHCSSLEPYTSLWSKENKKTVNMKYAHPSIGSGWSQHAKIYHALEKSGLVKYHSQVMSEARKNSSIIKDPNFISEMMSKEDAESFLEAYNSDEIVNLIRNSNSSFSKIGGTGVPTLLIDNQLVTSLSRFSSHSELIDMLDSFKENRRELKKSLEEAIKENSSPP